MIISHSIDEESYLQIKLSHLLVLYQCSKANIIIIHGQN